MLKYRGLVYAFACFGGKNGKNRRDGIMYVQLGSIAADAPGRPGVWTKTDGACQSPWLGATAWRNFTALAKFYGRWRQAAQAMTCRWETVLRADGSCQIVHFRSRRQHPIKAFA